MKKLQKINVHDKFTHIQNPWKPAIVGELNNQYVKIVKVKGKFPWHFHENEDELFLIIKGALLFEIENQEPFTMKKGDLFIVKKGISHKVSSKNECHIMLIENKSTLHTGEVVNEITKPIKNQI